MTKARSNATANAAKGDLTVGNGTNLSGILAVGSNGETIVADSSTATGLRYNPTQAAGKNCIINGGMDIWQRGTSVSTLGGYSADRWYILSGASATVTRSTAKTTPNSQYMMLMTATGTQQIFALQAVETLNAIYYAGKTVTVSAYAAGLTTTTNLNMALQYSNNADEAVMGTWTGITASGGSPDLTLSSTVTRFSATFAVPSTAKSLRVQFVNNAANITVGQGIYLGDVQLEVGSVATAFSRAGGTIQGELAACQRYFNGNTFAFRHLSGNTSSISYAITTYLPQMRSTPTLAFTAAASATNNILGTPTMDVLQSDTATWIARLNYNSNGANSDTFYVRAFSASAEL